MAVYETGARCDCGGRILLVTKGDAERGEYSYAERCEHGCWQARVAEEPFGLRPHGRRLW